jgi:hypothetical protein
MVTDRPHGRLEAGSVKVLWSHKALDLHPLQHIVVVLECHFAALWFCAESLAIFVIVV